MAKRVDGWRSESGRIFETEAEAVRDETRSEVRDELAELFEQADRLSYRGPNSLAGYMLERFDDLAKIVTPERATILNAGNRR